MIGTMSSTVSKMKAIQHRYNEAVSEVVDFGSGESRIIAEAFGQVVRDILHIEDEGWTIFSKIGVDASSKGISLDDARKVTTYVEKQTKVLGGLLGRGLRLKNNHAFGRGYEIRQVGTDEMKSWVKNIIQDEDNLSAVFSSTAIKELNRILFTSGNLILMYDSTDKTFERLSIDVNVQAALCYPQDKGRIKYILREYTDRDDVRGESKVVREWVPTLAYRERLRARKEKMPASIPYKASGRVEDSIPVRRDAVIIEKRINKDIGETWGIPDGFAAAPWAVMYSTYLKDGAKLQNALAAISFIVKAKTEVAAKAAGAKISSGRVAQAAITGPETSIDSMPRSGAVDLYEGRPLQAQAAASMDVSVTGLAADPGLGGSYASESALSQPEQLAALSRQEDFVDIFRQIFLAIGAKEMEINFRRLDVDPIHRTMQSLNMARDRGGINQEEYRKRTTELLDIDVTGRSLPELDEWTGKPVEPEPVDDSVDDSPDGTLPSSTPGQGVSGGVGSLDDNGNDARDSDLGAGTA